MKKTKVVLAIPDLHYPAAHPDALEFLKAVKIKFKPDAIICLGDEIDAQNLSEWPSDPDQPSAGDELRLAVEALKPLYKLFPKVSVCTSNHTARIFRKASKQGLPS